MRYYTQLTRFVARGPRPRNGVLYQKTFNQVNLVLYTFFVILTTFLLTLKNKWLLNLYRLVEKTHAC